MKTVLFALGFGIGTHSFMDFHISHDRFKMNINGKCVMNVNNPQYSEKNIGNIPNEFFSRGLKRHSNLRGGNFFPNHHFLGFWNSPINVNKKIEDIPRISTEQIKNLVDIPLYAPFDSAKTLTTIHDLELDLEQQENFFDPQTFKFFDPKKFQQKLKQDLQAAFEWGNLAKQSKETRAEQLQQQIVQKQQSPQTQMIKLVNDWKAHIQEGLGKKLIATEMAMNDDAIEGKFQVKEQ